MKGRASRTRQGREGVGPVADRVACGGGLDKAGVRVAGEGGAREDGGVVPGHRVAGAAGRKPGWDGGRARPAACAGGRRRRFRGHALLHHVTSGVGTVALLSS